MDEIVENKVCVEKRRVVSGAYNKEWGFKVLILFRDLVVLFMVFEINLKVI